MEVKSENVVLEDEQRLKGIDLSWFPFAARKYHVSDQLSDYVIFSTIICPSDIPNRNGIAFPLEELVKFTDTPSPHMVYQGWRGCPLHLEHCFPGDVHIKTLKGLKRIDSIKVGDKVLTHNLEYKPVTKVYENGVHNLMSIDALGLLRPLRLTENHPLWVVDRRQLYCSLAGKGVGVNKHPDTVKPHWRPASDVYPLDYLVAPISIGGHIKVSPSFAFLTGVYMAEGNLGPSNRSKKPKSVVITIAYNEAEFRDKITTCCDNLNLVYTVGYHKEKGICTINIKDAEFAQSMKRLCGCYSHKKRMKYELRKWDKKSITAFLGGYINGDGHNNGTRIRCVTTSENLAQDLQMCFGFLGVGASGNGLGWRAQFTDKRLRRDGYIRKDGTGKPWRSSKVTFTVGVSLRHVMDKTRITSYLTSKKMSKARRVQECQTDVRVFGPYMLFPISKIEYNIGKEVVYNLEVQDDHTYIADGVIVHNCNEDCTKAIGIIFDVSLMKMPEPYGQGRIHNVVGVCGIDKTKAPDIAQKFANGEIDTVSMGALADYFTCSICGAVIDQNHHCSHIKGTSADVNFEPVVDSFGNIHVAFLNAHGLAPIETSVVADPAWAPALSDMILQK